MSVCKTRKKNKMTEEEKEWRKDPNNWLWGLFYYNKKDKRLFAHGQYFGYTVNWGNPYSVITAIGIFIIVGIVSCLKNLMEK